MSQDDRAPDYLAGIAEAEYFLTAPIRFVIGMLKTLGLIGLLIGYLLYTAWNGTMWVFGLGTKSAAARWEKAIELGKAPNSGIFQIDFAHRSKPIDWDEFQRNRGINSMAGRTTVQADRGPHFRGWYPHPDPFGLRGTTFLLQILG
jgi:hypothetical protein